MLGDFQNSVTVLFFKKFAAKPMPYFPPHLRCVAALPCEIDQNWQNSAAVDTIIIIIIIIMRKFV